MGSRMYKHNSKGSGALAHLCLTVQLIASISPQVYPCVGPCPDNGTICNFMWVPPRGNITDSPSPDSVKQTTL